VPASDFVLLTFFPSANRPAVARPARISRPRRLARLTAMVLEPPLGLVAQRPPPRLVGTPPCGARGRRRRRQAVVPDVATLAAFEPARLLRVSDVRDVEGRAVRANPYGAAFGMAVAHGENRNRASKVDRGGSDVNVIRPLLHANCDARDDPQTCRRRCRRPSAAPSARRSARRSPTPSARRSARPSATPAQAPRVAGGAAGRPVFATSSIASANVSISSSVV